MTNSPLQDPAAADDVEAATSVPDIDVTDADNAASETSADHGEANQDAATQRESETRDDVPEETPQERLRRLEEEGDIAADYLEELLDIADLDGDIDIDVDGDRASVEIRSADQLVRMNGAKGELLDALQELTRLAVQTKTGNRSRLMLDIGGFRADRRQQLQNAAAAAIAEATKSGQPVALAPMNPFERKVIHDCARDQGLRSESDGEAKNRHVVIYPEG
ncbi:R3H domain-containing nucleic acid-binding protein [Devriesea agamarum]